MNALRGNPVARFWGKVKLPTDSGECFIWRPGPGGSSRYGRFSLSSRYVLAHRYAYEQQHGTISPGQEIDHLCRNPLCVNPMHLEAVWPTVNRKRQTEAKTHCTNGHSLENAIVLANGWRQCRECNRSRCAAHYAARKVR
jgi:hypothetical protein